MRVGMMFLTALGMALMMLLLNNLGYFKKQDKNT